MNCLNTPRSKGCYGPYEATSCAHCQSKEGRFCIAPRAKQGCDGPLYGTAACSVCKNTTVNVNAQTLSEFQTDRGLRGPWLKGLGLGGVRMQHIYDANTAYTPAQIDQKFLQQAADGGAAPCPWVQSDMLYATVTTGNDTGWRDLIEKLLQQPNANRSFAVFTGRHGVYNGTLTRDQDSELFSDKVADGNHLREDILQKQGLESKYAARQDKPRVRLFDVGTTQGTTMTRTQQLAMARMNMGDTVIFAWCWSLLSFYKAPVTGGDARKKVYDQSLAYNKPVSEIIADKYGWTKKLALVGDMYSDEYMSWRNRVAYREDDSRAGQKAARGIVGKEAQFAAVATHVHEH